MQTNDDALLDDIVLLAERKNLSIARGSIKSLPSTGFMSKVFGAQTGRGPAIIHLVQTPVEEQLYQNVPQKIDTISRLLQHIPEVPKIYATGELPKGGYFLVQELKSGTPLGKRSYRDHVFTDEFLVDDPNVYLPELQEILLLVHSVTSDKFGYIDFSKKIPIAIQDSWTDFLSVNLERNLQTLSASEKAHGISYFDSISIDETLNRALSIIDAHEELFKIDRAHLIHGDICNYSNVLISDTTIEGIVDFEWSLFGHPAWEFVFTKSPPLDTYIPKAIEKGIISPDLDFHRSIELHNIFWCAWGAAVHAGDPEFGPSLFSTFSDALVKNS